MLPTYRITRTIFCRQTIDPLTCPAMPKKLKRYLLKLHLNFGRHWLRLSYSISEAANGNGVAGAIKDALAKIDALPGKGRKENRGLPGGRRKEDKD